MKKTKLTIIMSIAALVITVVCICAYIPKNKGVNNDAQLREENEILTAETVYLDPQAVDAVPLDSSLYDAGLRAAAMAVCDLVNTQRASSGLQPLAWDGALEAASAVRATEASQSFSHTRPDGTAWYTVNSKIQGGENLAFGYNDPESAMVAWMNSPTHAQNIMYSRFTKLGVSCYVADNGKMYWAQEFGY